jgi:23S rRNA pseudouridine1911/1915/1917 synthase
MPDPLPSSDSATSIALGEAGGARLDRFLVDALGVSRSQARTLLASGAVSLGGRTLGYGDKGLSLPGEGTLEIARFRRPDEQRPSLPDGPADEVAVLASGPGWLAVDKPAGAPVHPLSEDETGTLLNRVVARHPEIHGVGEGGLRSGVLHRLDVDTSGALLFATDEPAWQRLRRAFQEHRVLKVYRAIVAGELPGSNEGSMAFELAVARHRPARVRVVDETWSKPARSYPARQEVHVLERFAGATLVEVRIETGFLHQIRVILAYLGHPVVGDALYGDEPALSFGASRQMLHAARVAFEEIEAGSPDPEDFAETLRTLRAGGDVG